MKQQGNQFYLGSLEFITGLSVEETEEFERICEYHGVTVKQVLTQFVCDLIDSDRSGGSDERMMISEWFLRSFERGDVHG